MFLANLKEFCKIHDNQCNDNEKNNATGDSNFTHQLNCVVLG